MTNLLRFMKLEDIKSMYSDDARLFCFVDMYETKFYVFRDGKDLLYVHQGDIAQSRLLELYDAVEYTLTFFSPNKRDTFIVFDDKLGEFLTSNRLTFNNINFNLFYYAVGCSEKYYHLFASSHMQSTFIEHHEMNGELLIKRFKEHYSDGSFKYFYPQGHLKSKTMDHFLSFPSSSGPIFIRYEQYQPSDVIRFLLHSKYNPKAISTLNINFYDEGVNPNPDHIAIHTIDSRHNTVTGWSTVLNIVWKHVKMGNNARQRDIPGFEQEMIDAGFEKYL